MVIASTSINLECESRSGAPREYTGKVPRDFRTFPAEAVEQSIPSRFAEQARLSPEKTAIQSASDRITYRRLDESSSHIAGAIFRGREDGDEPVALLIEQDIDKTVAMLATLKAGAFYLPLDTTNPVSRLQTILEDSGASLIVTNNKNLDFASQLSEGCAVLNVDEIAEGPVNLLPEIEISPASLAYILYTSGSTGRPKGVLHSHQTILHNVRRFTNSFFMSPSDRQSMLYNSSMYGGQRDILCTLLNGATLFLYPLKQRGVNDLARWLIENRISSYCSVVTVFRHFLESLEGAEEFPDLRLVKIGGEAVHERDVEGFRNRFGPHCVLHSGLGLTEAGLVRNFFFDRNSELPRQRVPLGYPVEDMDVLLLDEDRTEVPVGEVGEIVVRSPYVALGYWRRPDLNKLAFRQDSDGDRSRLYHTGDLGILREDGCLEHRGRKDFQIKIRGNRVETVEVEMALLNLADIQESVVMVRQDSRGDAYLAAYVVPVDGRDPAITELRAQLSKRLPDFMIPSTFALLDELPLLANGKVDRQKLPEQTHSRSETHRPPTPPGNAVERGLVEIWTTALRLDSLGIQDDFFELGGHSLIAVQVMTEIRERFGQKLPLATLFKASTIERLAKLIQDADTEESWSPLVAIRPNGSRPPLFFVHPAGGNVLGYSEFAEFLHPDQPFYGLQAFGIIEGQEPHDDVGKMASIYVAAIRGVQPHGPYYLGGESFGGTVAFEVAQRFIEEGEEVALLVLGDTWMLKGPHLKPWRYRMSAFTYPLSIPLHEWPKLIARKLFKKPRIFVKRYTFSDDVHRQLVLSHRRAKQQYVAKEYPGSVTLIRAQEYRRQVYRLQHYFGGPAMGWDALAKGGVEIHYIDDIHREIMHGRHAARFAAILTDCLNRARGK